MLQIFGQIVVNTLYTQFLDYSCNAILQIAHQASGAYCNILGPVYTEVC